MSKSIITEARAILLNVVIVMYDDSIPRKGFGDSTGKSEPKGKAWTPRMYRNAQYIDINDANE